MVVDDDQISNIICEGIIKYVFPSASKQAFTNPQTALVYIKSTYAEQNSGSTILFLDINMPEISGWEFLEAFEQFDSSIKRHLKIYMLSSSIDYSDKERAACNKNVFEYLEKPLSIKCIENILCAISQPFFHFSRFPFHAASAAFYQ